MRKVMLLLAGLLWASAPVQALEIAGVRLADTQRVGETTLLLNGAGVRSRLLFKVYIAALYLPARQTRAEAVLAASPPRRMQLTMLGEHPVQANLKRALLGERWRQRRDPTGTRLTG